MSRAFHCDALDTPHAYIFRPKKNLAQNGATTLKESGLNIPFRAFAAEMEDQYVRVSSYNIPASRMLIDGGHWAGWDSIWVVWDLYRT